MWLKVVLAALSAAPEIIRTVEKIVGAGKGAEKHQLATQQFADIEGHLANDPDVQSARDKKIQADVAYAKALESAAKLAGEP